MGMKTSNSIAACLIVAAGLLASTLSTAAANGATPRHASATPTHAPDQRGTPNAPVVVQLLPTKPTADDLEREARDRQARADSDAETVRTNQWLIRIGAGQLSVFALQLAVFGYQARKLRETVDAAGEQATEMRQSVAEAARAATAMERLADQMTRMGAMNAEAFANQKVVLNQQVRAWVHVNFGTCIPQDRSTGYRLETIVSVANAGHTPARALNVARRLAILPFPLPDDFDFTLPESQFDAAGSLVPGQSLTFRQSLPTLITDAEVAEIRGGGNRRIYQYGVVRYKDTFNEEHYTNFCQWITWDVKDLPTAINHLRHNDLT